MIRLRGLLTCRSADDLAIVQQHLPEHIRLSRLEAGCLSFEVTQTDDPMIWEVRESFCDRAAFDAHQARTASSAWFAATKTIPRAFQIEDGRE